MWIEKKDENLVNQPTQSDKTNTPTVGAGGGAETGVSTTPASGNFSTTSPVQAPQTTQKWATAQDYLKANQPQATQLGQKVETYLTGKLGEQRSAIDTAAQAAQSQIESGTTAFNPELAKSAVETPTEITSSPDKLQDFLGQWNATYKGPTSFETTESYTPAAEAAAKAKEISGEITTPGGRNQLLQNQFGVYGAGNQALDTSLLSTAENYGDIQQLAPQFASLQDYLGQKSTGLGTAAQQAQETTQGAQTQTRAALANKFGDFQKQISDQTAAAQQKAQEVADKYNTDLTSGDENAITIDLKAAGATDAEIKKVTDYMSALTDFYKGQIVPSQFYTFNPATGIDKANVATPEQYNQAQAWQQLSGVDYSGILNPADITKAGTAPNPQTGINAQTLQNYLTPMVKQRDQELLVGPNAKNTISTNMSSLGGDVTKAKALAQQYINAANREGGLPSDLGVEANRQFVLSLGGDQMGRGQMNPMEPSVQGLREFANQLSIYQYGWPSYPDVNY
jgi:hypothetical protein